jgi:hypothetical protein
MKKNPKNAKFNLVGLRWILTGLIAIADMTFLRIGRSAAGMSFTFTRRSSTCASVDMIILKRCFSPSDTPYDDSSIVVHFLDSDGLFDGARVVTKCHEPRGPSCRRIRYQKSLASYALYRRTWWRNGIVVEPSLVEGVCMRRWRVSVAWCNGSVYPLLRGVGVAPWTRQNVMVKVGIATGTVPCLLFNSDSVGLVARNMINPATSRNIHAIHAGAPF